MHIFVMLQESNSGHLYARALSRTWGFSRINVIYFRFINDYLNTCQLSDMRGVYHLSAEPQAQKA